PLSTAAQRHSHPIPYTPLFRTGRSPPSTPARSSAIAIAAQSYDDAPTASSLQYLVSDSPQCRQGTRDGLRLSHARGRRFRARRRSEEHTSELQSPDHLVRRLLL